MWDAEPLTPAHACNAACCCAEGHLLLEVLVQPKLARALDGVATQRGRPATHQPFEATLAVGDAKPCGNALVLAGVGLQEERATQQQGAAASCLVASLPWRDLLQAVSGDPHHCGECCRAVEGAAASWPAAQGKLTQPIWTHCTWLGPRWQGPAGKLDRPTASFWANSKQQLSGWHLLVAAGSTQKPSQHRQAKTYLHVALHNIHGRHLQHGEASCQQSDLGWGPPYSHAEQQPD